MSELVKALEERNATLAKAAPDLLAALEGMIAMYKGVVDSGDCGNWDAETIPAVIAGRKAIAKATNTQRA